MYFPFLPFIIAFSAVGLMTAIPGETAPAPWPTLAVWLAYALLPLVGIALGSLPRPPVRLGARNAPWRWPYLALWLMVLISTDLPARLLLRFEGWPAPESWVLALLAMNYWVGDTATLNPGHTEEHGALPGEERPTSPPGFFHRGRMSLPVVLLLIVGSVFSGAAHALGEHLLGDAWIDSAWLMVLPWLMMGLVAVVLMPVMVRWGWGLQPLAQHHAALLQDAMGENGATVREVLAWPEHMTGQVTAGVIGIVPRFRYLLFSPTLMHALGEDEIRSVAAHEAAHIRHRHLWYFLAAIVGAVLCLEALSLAMVWVSLLWGASPSPWLPGLLQIVGLLLFFRFVLGFVSRNFERQADGHALRAHGIAPFQGALAKLAVINRIPLDADNWHHFGIARRLDFARGEETLPARVATHDRRVARIKLSLLGLLVLGAVLQAGMSGQGARDWMTDRYAESMLEGVTVYEAAHLPALRHMAQQAVQAQNHPMAIGYYRAILTLAPEDARIRNNLAWMLVTQPGADTGTLEEGLDHASRAAREDPQAFILDTLAEAQWRRGHTSQARETALRALEMAQRGQGRGGVGLDYYRERLDTLGGAGAH